MFKLPPHFPSFINVPSLHFIQLSRLVHNSQPGEQADYYYYYY